MAREVYLNRHGHWYVEGDGTCNKGHYYNESDAREAAAAPDLKDTLELIAPIIDEFGSQWIKDKVNSAIAKAKGASGG